MGRRRRRRTRSDSGGDAGTSDGFPTFQHNQWTFEGYIERLRAFSRGAARAHGWRRALAVGLAALFLVPFVIGVAMYLANLIGDAL